MKCSQMQSAPRKTHSHRTVIKYLPSGILNCNLRKQSQQVIISSGGSLTDLIVFALRGGRGSLIEPPKWLLNCCIF